MKITESAKYGSVGYGLVSGTFVIEQSIDELNTINLSIKTTGITPGEVLRKFEDKLCELAHWIEVRYEDMSAEE